MKKVYLLKEKHTNGTRINRPFTNCKYLHKFLVEKSSEGKVIFSISYRKLLSQAKEAYENNGNFLIASSYVAAIEYENNTIHYYVEFLNMQR